MKIIFDALIRFIRGLFTPCVDSVLSDLRKTIDRLDVAEKGAIETISAIDQTVDQLTSDRIAAMNERDRARVVADNLRNLGGITPSTP